MAKATVIRDVDHGYKRIRKLAANSDARVVAIGFLEGAPPRDDGMTNAEVATVHEYGAPNAGIPERSFVRSTIDGNARQYGRLGKHLAGMAIDGAISHDQALGIMGARVVADIKRTIQRGVPPPLKEATILRKKSSKPLIDTAQMINATNWEVRDDEPI